MSKATTASVSLLFIACVCAFWGWFSAPLAATAIISALLLALVLVVTLAGMRSRPGRRNRQVVLYGVAASMVLLVPVLVWASFGTAFRGIATLFSTGSITLSNPEGMTVDSQGNVYVADTNNNQVVEVTTAGVASAVSFPGLSPALSGPQAVAVDGSGNLYVADSGNARVVELAAGVATVVPTASLLSYPDGLAFDPADDLFISDRTNNNIVTVPAGGTAAVLAVTGLGTALSHPTGLGCDASGKLYIADSSNNRIVIVAPGGAATVLNIVGGLTLNNPLGLAVDPSGDVFVADQLNSRVVDIAPSGVPTVIQTASFTQAFSQGVAVSVAGAIYIGDTNNNRILEVQPVTVGFGHLPLGTGSGTTLALPFSVANGTTLSSVQAFTQGTPSLDFTVVSAGTTCIAGTTGTQSCNVNVQFLPTAAGLRRGAVVLFDNSTPPVPIFTVPIYATTDAPVAALNPGTASVVSTGGVVTTLPFQLAFDGAGNIYSSDYSDHLVVKIPAGGGTGVAVNTGAITLQNVTGVALDGAGNLFIADHLDNRIVVVTPAGVSSVLTISGISPGLDEPTGLAMDAAGNLYISDWQNGRIVKVSSLLVGASSSGAGTVLATGSFTIPLGGDTGVAVDPQGNVYIADRSNNRVIKVTPAGAASLVLIPGLTPAFSNPQGVGADGMGNIYIADSGNNRIVQVTSAGVASAVQTPGLPNPTTLGSPFGVSVDPAGNIFIPDWTNSRIVTVKVGASSLAFANTNVGSTSSAKTTTVTNVGDLPLVFAADPGYTANFSQPTGATNQCLLATSLTAGTVCNVSIQFTPQAAGILSAGIVLTDNHLNLTDTTQNVAVSGTGVAVADSTAVTVSTLPTSVTLGQAITITAVVTDTAAGHTATIPTGGVTFLDTVGATVISLNGGSAVTLNGAGDAILSGVMLSGAGMHTITANYVGVVNTFLSSSNTTTIPVSLITPTINWTAPGSAITYGTTLTGILNATAVNASTPVAGTFTYTATLGAGSPFAVTSASVLGAGSYTLTATFTPTDPTTYASATANISLVVAKAAPAVALISSANPALVATSVTFTATVSSSAGTPSGSVNFYDGATLLGSGTLAEGVATYATSSLAAGAHAITAAYAGDSNFSALTSAVLTETVTAVVTATTVIAAPSPAIAGQSVTLTATVTPAPTGTPTGTVNFYNGTTLLGNGIVNSSGIATFTSGSLPVGALSITAVYSGNAGSAGSTSTAFTETVTAIATTVNLIAAPDPAIAGQSVTLTATVTPAPTGTPTGTVNFYDGTTLLGNGIVNSSGIATFTSSSLPVGALSITAVYSGNAGSAGSTSTAFTETVTAIVTTVNLIAAPDPAIAGQSVTLTATVTPAPTGTPAGTVNFYNGLTLLSAVTVNSSGIATFTSGTLPVGALSITANYSGNAAFASSNSTAITETVTAVVTTIALIAAPDPAIAGQSVILTATVAPAPTGTPTGTVSFYNGTTLLSAVAVNSSGIATFTISTLPAGALSMTAVYSGNAGSAGSTSTAVTETVAPANVTTSTVLTALPNPLADGQPATLTATVSPAPTGSPAGTVSFYSGTTLLGTSTLSQAGGAVFTSSSLVVGADSITAVYSGNEGFAPSTSSAVSETVTTAYSLTGPDAPVSVAPGGSVAVNLTVPPLGGPFDSVVTLSATGLPTGATATFNPATVTPGTTGAPTVMTIQLATLAAGAPVRDFPVNQRRLPVAAFSLAFVMFGAVFGRKRIPRTLVLALALGGVGVTAAVFTGCGGGFANPASTPPGTYAVTVTGTSGTFQASTTVTLVVE